MSRLRRLHFELAYRLHLAFWDTGIPTPELVDVVDGPMRRPPGRAVDLGCGTGTNAVYLAQHGWEVTGIDLVPRALAAARRRAAKAGISVRLLEGDVTRLEELGIGGGYNLLVDIGCFHSVPRDQRDAYAAGATRVAAPGALLLMLGVTKAPVPGIGVTAGELRDRFAGWRLVTATRVSGEELRRRGWPTLIRIVVERTPFEAWCYRLERTAVETVS